MYLPHKLVSCCRVYNTSFISVLLVNLKNSLALAFLTSVHTKNKQL